MRLDPDGELQCGYCELISGVETSRVRIDVSGFGREHD